MVYLVGNKENRFKVKFLRSSQSRHRIYFRFISSPAVLFFK